MPSLSAIKLAAGFALAWGVGVVLQKYAAAKSVASTLKGCPGGSIIWIHPFRTAALVLGNYFPPRGWMGSWFESFSPYVKHESTCISTVTFWNALPVYWLSDADAIHTVQKHRTVFPKDVEAYETLNIYGQTIVGAEGHDWKRHRACANSAFNEANNNFVWRETCRVVREWFSEIDDKHQAQVGANVDIHGDLTQATLHVISGAGFGRRTSWKDDTNTEPPPGHTRTFRHAISSTLKNILTKVMIPEWMLRLSSVVYVPIVSPHLLDTRESFDALKHHMLEVVGSARDWIAGGKITQMDAGLLRNLVEANMVQEGENYKHLTDDELLSDIFTFLTAGHETSAHSLCFTILLLALHPDVQRRAYQETCQLWPERASLANISSSYKESMARLEYLSAIFHETLRLFSPVPRLAKCIAQDTTLRARRFKTDTNGKVKDVEEYHIPLKAGGIVLVDISGLHMNPIHWGDDAAIFKPERFLDSDTYRWPREAFQAFSGGARSCIGQRFALTESVCILAHVVRKYEIDVPEELKSKPWGEQREIMLKWKPGITIVPLNGKVIFRQRPDA